MELFGNFLLKEVTEMKKKSVFITVIFVFFMLIIFGIFTAFIYTSNKEIEMDSLLKTSDASDVITQNTGLKLDLDFSEHQKFASSFSDAVKANGEDEIISGDLSLKYRTVIDRENVKSCAAVVEKNGNDGKYMLVFQYELKNRPFFLNNKKVTCSSRDFVFADNDPDFIPKVFVGFYEKAYNLKSGETNENFVWKEFEVEELFTSGGRIDFRFDLPGNTFDDMTMKRVSNYVVQICIPAQLSKYGNAQAVSVDCDFDGELEYFMWEYNPS